MNYSRREFGRVALAGLPAVALFERPLFETILAQAKPNSVIKGVQIGIITYSYGGMPDQGGVATLKYVVDSGISAIELMDGPAEEFAGRPAAAARGGGGGGRAAGAAPAPGGAGGDAGRGPANAAPGGGAPAAGGRTGAPAGPGPGALAGGPTEVLARGGGGRAALPPDAAYNGQPCASIGRGGPGGGGAAAGAAGAGAGAAGAAAGRAGRAGGAVPLTAEQIAAQQASQQEATQKLKEWRTSVSMDKFKQLRKMYNDAGVTIFAYKPDGLQKSMQTSNEEWDYVFNVAVAMGANQLTMELPAGQDAEAMLKKVSGFAEKHKIYVSYHSHEQGSMTGFDQAIAISKANMIGVDLGHYVAGGNKGGDPIQFLEKHHDRILSFHIKDRTQPEHCSLNLAWGLGETPLKQILQTVQKNKWKMIPTIELEYGVPAGSDKVQEARKCVQYCRDVLA